MARVQLSSPSFFCHYPSHCFGAASYSRHVSLTERINLESGDLPSSNNHPHFCSLRFRNPPPFCYKLKQFLSQKMPKPGKQKARAHHVGTVDAEIVILTNTPTPHVCYRKNCIKVKFQSRHTARQYNQRLCNACPPDRVKSAIDKVLTADETYFTKSINLVLVATSGASIGKEYNPHFPRDFGRICDAIKLSSGESVNISFAIVRGKVPVCISPSLRDRWLTLMSPPKLAFWFIGGLYIMITSILAGVGFGMNHVGAQGAFYGLLGEI